MSETPSSPWIHIGQCPVCVNGLCRVRTCADAQGREHLYAMCDECEALWLLPSTETPRTFPDSCDPKCPICNRELYGEQAHWSSAQELNGTPWLEQAIFDSPDAEAIDFLAQDASYGQDEPKPGC